MADAESVKKMLRAVLQSSKGGVPINNLQSEYRSLCGEIVPLKKLGFSKLEDYLRSIPSVVKLEYRMGQLQCLAAVCEETAHIAELVAKQRSSKKCGRSQVVNCKMRFKLSSPYMLNATPRTSLRQPSARSASNSPENRSWPHGGYRGFSASGDYRKLDQNLSSITPVEHRQPAPRSALKPEYDIPSRKEMNLANCKNSREVTLERESMPSKSQVSVYDMELVQSRMTQLLEKYCSGLWMSKLSEVYCAMFGQKLHPQVLRDMERWTHVCMTLRVCAVDPGFLLVHNNVRPHVARVCKHFLDDEGIDTIYLSLLIEVEQPSTNQADQLVYPPLPFKTSPVLVKSTIISPRPSPSNSSTISTPFSSYPSTPENLSTPPLPSPIPKPTVSLKSPLAKPTFIFPPEASGTTSGSGFPSVPLRSPALAPRFQPHGNGAAHHGNFAVVANDGCKDSHRLPTANFFSNQNTRPSAFVETPIALTNTSAMVSPSFDILPLLKATFRPTSDSVPGPPSKSCAVVSAEVRQRIKELLSKYTHGLWAHALPRLFMDAYKVPFPEHVLDNLSLLLDICSVEYPLPHDKKKAILYNSCRADTKPTESQENQQCISHPLPSGVKVLSSVVPPSLVLPSEQYPSVLVTEVKTTNAVTVRYVGENYSNAQEAMEHAMQSFYIQSSMQCPVSNPVVGQLVAVRGEDGDELARGQVLEVTDPNKVKVYYMDYGFSVETSMINLLELHKDFLSLPFQATNVRLAGLEEFSSHPLVLSLMDNLAVGKILLMETLEPCQENEVPTAVLYDTSLDDDVNINSTCLKALQDKTMNNPLTVNVIYQDVSVTNVCPDGILYCQLPSRGTARLSKLLEETEAYFISQMTSEFLVSRPFSGKFCLAHHKGKWARVEISNMYGSRVMEVFFIDFGVSATLELTDLREIPPLLLKDFTIIPPQAIKCRLADLPVPEGDWCPEVILCVKEAVMGSEDCKMKILKLDQDKGDKLVYMYLFIGVDSQELDQSINHQLAQLWKKVPRQDNNIITSYSVNTDSTMKALSQPCHAAGDAATKTQMRLLQLPPPLNLPLPGQNMDVFVPVACHPGYFVLQPWHDLHKLVVLMGEMMLYYNQAGKTNPTTDIQKGQVYAAKIDKNWHRVKVKGILANGLVSLYELDYGKHELVHSALIRPLIEEFRQLPFQAITAQLAGVKQRQWSGDASMLFRNHVENRALVAVVDSMQDVSVVKGEPWECRLTVYLVDTTVDNKDLWIHTLMTAIDAELYSAA